MTYRAADLAGTTMCRRTVWMHGAHSASIIWLALLVCFVIPQHTYAQVVQDVDFYVEQYIASSGQQREDARLALVNMWSESVVSALAQAIVTDPRFQESKLRYRTFLLLRNQHAYEYGSAVQALLSGLEFRSSVGLSAQMLGKTNPDHWPAAVQAITSQLGKSHTYDEGMVSELTVALAHFGAVAQPAFEAVKQQVDNQRLTMHDRQTALASLAYVGRLGEVLDYYATISGELRVGVVNGLGGLRASPDSILQRHPDEAKRAQAMVLDAISDSSEVVSEAALRATWVLLGEDLYTQGNDGKAELNPLVSEAIDKGIKVFAGLPWQTELVESKARFQDRAALRSQEDH